MQIIYGLQVNFAKINVSDWQFYSLQALAQGEMLSPGYDIITWTQNIP